MKTRFLIGLFVAVVASACSSSNTCYEDMGTSFRITMHKQVFDTEKEKYVEQEFQNEVSIKGLGKDSILYNHVTGSKFEMPLNKLDSLSVFLIEQRRIEGEDTLYIGDTLRIEHVNTLYFVSLECGCASIFDVTSVTHSVNMIDSVKLIERHVDRNKVNNLKIFVRK